MLPKVFDTFVEASPVSVMARGLAERLLDARKLDAWFENLDTTQYTRDLPFSAVFSLISQAVAGESLPNALPGGNRPTSRSALGRRRETADAWG